MVDDGQALAVMGNHELNMVLFHSETGGRPLKAREGKAWSSHLATVRTVSYTHLDVYKRQC